MLVELKKEDLISLVVGTQPNYSLFEDATVKKCGWYQGSHDIWSWYAHELEKLSEEELLLLYTLCKASWLASKEQLEQTDIMCYANAYKDLKAFLLAKKNSRRLCAWDDIHHQEIWDKMLELEKKYTV